ncbi:MAG: hypothetical protein ACYCZR_15210 [Burkholderiales bacterium]
MTDKPKPTQLDKFKEAAREVETDDREETFDRALKRVAKSVPHEKSGSAKA